MHFIGIIFTSALVIMSCTDNAMNKELASDKVIHMEDSVHYSLPELPRLCNYGKNDFQTVNIGNCSLFVEVEGRGIPIVVINGGPGGTHHTFHPYFSKIKNSHKVIYYDQRGTGLSDFEKGDGFTFKQAIDDLENLRINLNIPRWFVCGFSYGGGLAQFYTASYPESVLGMVLISSLPLFEDKGFLDEQEKFLSQLEIDKKKEIITEFIEGNLTMKPFLYNLALNGDWKRQNYYKPSKEEMIRSALYEWVNDDDFNSLMTQSYSSYNFSNLFDNCPIPTLIFEGKYDLTWGSKKANIFRANHPNAEYLLFEHSAHKIFYDEPNKFFSKLNDFTTSIQPPALDLINEWKEQISNKIEL